MTRSTLAAANREQAQASAKRMVYFVKVAFPGALGGAIYASTGSRTYRWDGQVWSARWVLSKLPEPVEQGDLKSHGISLVFSGLDQELIERILTDKYHFAEVSCWKGFCDKAWNLVTTPHRMAKGFLSNCAVRVDGDEDGNVAGGITMTAEGPEVFWARDAAQLATPESQRLRHPTDTGLDRILEQTTIVIEWGGRPLRGGGGGGGGGPGSLGAPIGGSGGGSDDEAESGGDYSNIG